MKYYILLLFVFLISFFGVSQKLENYHCISNHWDVEGFMQSFNRRFDNEGVVIQKGGYHPLIIAFYGIINYDQHLKEGDSLSYQRVLNQYKFFQDSSNLDYFNNDTEIGLPYRYKFADLKSPWYSGMTQGTAISYLLRYYDLTHDQTALDLVEKLMKFMLKSVEEGGTIRHESDSLSWIEEYPNSKRSKSVLNGFVNGLIGLKEYCDFFPEDTTAKQIHDKSYAMLFETLVDFDKPNWTSYSLGGKQVSKAYMRYQLSEFDHLYHIYKDERFRLQMMLWAYFAHQKIDREIKFYKFPEFVYAQKLSQINDSLFIQDPSRFLSGLDTVIVDNEKRRNTIKLHLKTNFANFQKDDETKIKRLAFYAEGEEVSFNFNADSNSVDLVSDTGFDEIRIRYKLFSKKKSFIDTIFVQNKLSYQSSFFGFHLVNDVQTLDSNEVVKFNPFQQNTGTVKVFYRFAENKRELQKAKYSIQQVFNYKNGEFRAPSDGVYQFLISFDVNHPKPYLRLIDFVKSE